MAAIVTLPPAIVGTPTVVNRAGNIGTNTFNFEFSSPTRLYQVIVHHDDDSIAVCKSTDNGASWSTQDQSNSPQLATIPQLVVSQVRGDIITILYAPLDALGLRIITFDTSTDTYGTISSSGPITQLSKGFLLQLPSNGDYYVFYTKGSPLTLYYKTFIGGAWGVETQVTSEVVNVFLTNVLIDPDERMHLFYATVTDGLKEITVLANVIGVATVVAATVSAGRSFSVGQPTIRDQDIVIPLIGPNPAALATVIVGTPYSNPVWDAELIVDSLPTVTLGGSDNLITSCVSIDGLTAYVFWIALDYSDVLNVIDQLWYVENSGSGWSAPILYYDAVANPQLEDPTVTPLNQDLHTLSAIVLSSGVFSVCSALEENGFCAGYYFLEGNCAFSVLPVTIAHSVIGGERYLPVDIIGEEVGGGTLQVISYEITDSNGNPSATALPPGMTIGVRSVAAGPVTQTTNIGPVVSDNVVGVVLGSYGASGGTIAPGGGGSGGNVTNNTQPLPDNKPVIYTGKVRLIA